MRSNNATAGRTTSCAPEVCSGEAKKERTKVFTNPGDLSKAVSLWMLTNLSSAPAPSKRSTVSTTGPKTRWWKTGSPKMFRFRRAVWRNIEEEGPQKRPLGSRKSRHSWGRGEHRHQESASARTSVAFLPSSVFSLRPRGVGSRQCGTRDRCEKTWRQKIQTLN